MSRSNTVYLVSCGKYKTSCAAPARDLYTGALFIKSRQYAEATGLPWQILSAKHGLLSPEAIIAPYEQSLKSANAKERKRWAEMVEEQLKLAFPMLDTVVFLAGKDYSLLLSTFLNYRYIKTVDLLQGLALGKRLEWLNEANHAAQQSMQSRQR